MRVVHLPQLDRSALAAVLGQDGARGEFFSPTSTACVGGKLYYGEKIGDEHFRERDLAFWCRLAAHLRERGKDVPGIVHGAFHPPAGP